MNATFTSRSTWEYFFMIYKIKLSRYRCELSRENDFELYNAAQKHIDMLDNSVNESNEKIGSSDDTLF